MEEQTQSYQSERFDKLEDQYNTILLRLDPTPTLETIRRTLQRKTLYNEDKNIYVRVDGVKPLFSEEGIEDLMADLYARLGVDKALSNLSEETIKRMVWECEEVVNEFLFVNSEYYNIEVENFDRIAHIILHNIESWLRRAKDGRENNLLSKQFIYRENMNLSQNVKTDDNQQQSSGLRNFFKGRGGLR